MKEAVWFGLYVCEMCTGLQIGPARVPAVLGGPVRHAIAVEASSSVSKFGRAVRGRGDNGTLMDMIFLNRTSKLYMRTMPGKMCTGEVHLAGPDSITFENTGANASKRGTRSCGGVS